MWFQWLKSIFSNKKEIGLFRSEPNAFFLDSLVCYSTFTNFLTRQLCHTVYVAPQCCFFTPIPVACEQPLLIFGGQAWPDSKFDVLRVRAGSSRFSLLARRNSRLRCSSATNKESLLVGYNFCRMKRPGVLLILP